ncbi:hypothetical protein [Arthrobacter sp. SX1312]|nr:hypothetical protein [Arthrobacter sp. SX1312]
MASAPDLSGRTGPAATGAPLGVDGRSTRSIARAPDAGRRDMPDAILP